MTKNTQSRRNEIKISPKVVPAPVVFWTDSQGELKARSGQLGNEKQ
jgi:hypothetical protein